MLNDILTNRILIIPLCCWAIAQILKMIVVLVQKRELNFSYLVRSGGMPSSHSALVSALATSVAFSEGLGSVSFGIAAIFAMVVVYDAAGVRRSVGQQAAALNRIIKELREHRPMVEVSHELREFVGHTQLQVIIGIGIGIAVSWSWYAIAGPV